MSTKFTLTVTVEGESLQEIDDALCRAAGERLMARMTNPPSLTPTIKRGEVVHREASVKVDEHRASEGAAPAPKGPTAAQLAARDHATQRHIERSAAKKEADKKAEEDEQKKEEEPEHIRALKAVYEKFKEPGVEEVMNHFGITKLRDLPVDKRESFVQICNQKLEKKNETSQPEQA